MSDDEPKRQKAMAELIDRDAIETVLASIASATDRFDQKLLAECIRPDAKLNMGAGAVTGTAFVDMLAPPAKPPQGRMHFLGNIRVVIDGDAAKSEAYVLSCQQVEADALVQTRIRAGRYLDVFVRDEGRWRLSERTFVDEWARTDEVKTAAKPGANRGRPKPNDMVYALFGAEAFR